MISVSDVLESGAV